jgi:hypothetical protein
MESKFETNLLFDYAGDAPAHGQLALKPGIHDFPMSATDEARPASSFAGGGTTASARSYGFIKKQPWNRLRTQVVRLRDIVLP